jgi:tRNA dimethylallyltransferase
MMQNGWLGEVATLRAEGFRASDPGFRAIGYRILWDHLDGNGNLDEAVLRIEQQTWQYAKRQVTWLRSEPGLRVRESEPDAATMESWLELFLAGGSNGQSH